LAHIYSFYKGISAYFRLVASVTLKPAASHKNYFFRVRMHLFINKDEKICILENRTEIEVADYLIEKGIPKSDIIPAFLPSEARQLAGFAV
jgi:hypothetical protein